MSRIPSLMCTRPNFQFHIHKTHKLSVSLHIITYLSSHVRMIFIHWNLLFFSFTLKKFIIHRWGAKRVEWIRVKRSNYKMPVINAIICKQYNVADGFYDCFRWYNPLYYFTRFSRTALSKVYVELMAMGKGKGHCKLNF